MQSQQDFDGTKRTSFATEVVADCTPRTSEEMDDAILSKEPSVQPDIQTAAIHSGDIVADRKTGLY